MTSKLRQVAEASAMLDAVAMAIQVAAMDSIVIEDWPHHFARAALTALREPSPEMIEAATNGVLQGISKADAIYVWKVMLNTLLAEKETG